MENLRSEESRTGKVPGMVARTVANKLIKKGLIWLFHAVGWPAILTLFVFSILLAPVMGASGAVYNFLSNPQVDTKSDQRLKTQYDNVSVNTVDASLVTNDPGLSMYQVPWYLFAAIDKVNNNCENPQPTTYAAKLKPTFNMKSSIINTVTTVVDSDYGASVSEDNATIQLVDTVDTYKGTYHHNYVASTTTTSSSRSVIRYSTSQYSEVDPITKKVSYYTETTSYTATITTTVAITKDILYNIQEPMPANYTKFVSALKSFGIKNNNDQELVWQLAKHYSGQDVDLTQPVDMLMGFGDVSLSMGSGATPPASWLPWFRVAAERYHGETPVAQYEALLMAIGFTESSFSESRDKVSYADARGPFQFTDDTWYDYGIKQLGYSVDDVWVAEKAVMASALMIGQTGAANGDLGGIRAALWRYNQSTEYGNLVIGRMFYYGTLTGWAPDGGTVLLPGSASTQGFYWPVPNNNIISCAFGPRIHPVTGKAGYHTGIDIAAPLNMPIIASKNGIVEIFNTNSEAYGYYLVIGHGDHVETMYGHIQDVAPGIVEGVEVKVGQVIAYVGNRGYSTGPHLHFETHYLGSPVNPMLFINQPN